MRVRHVDVFVRKINAAHKADQAVYHGDLAVIAVVMRNGNDGTEGVELFGEDPLFIQHFIKVCGNAGKAADIVVKHVNLNAFLQLVEKDLVNAVPHLPFGDNEVFQKDILLRF